MSIKGEKVQGESEKVEKRIKITGVTNARGWKRRNIQKRLHGTIKADVAKVMGRWCRNKGISCQPG